MTSLVELLEIVGDRSVPSHDHTFLVAPHRLPLYQYVAGNAPNIKK